MILNSTIISLQAVLAGAVSANQPECHVNFTTWDTAGVPSKPGTQRTALNSTTDVTILSAPNTAGIVIEPTSISLYNKDTASVTVTVKTDDGTTERIIAKTTLLTLETLCYEKGQGWYALDANGNRKEATSSVFSSLTVTTGAAVGGATPGTGGIAFPSTAVAVSDPNTLDDYEEGNWTPTPTNLTVVGTPTYTGRYTKIGRLVFVTLLVTSTTSTASTAGTTYFSGLPFTPATVGTAGFANADATNSYGTNLLFTDGRLYCPTWAATPTVYASGFFFV